MAQEIDSRLEPGEVTLGAASCCLSYFGTLEAEVRHRARMRQVRSLQVRPDMRGKGEATRLIHTLCAFADAEGLGLVLMPSAYEAFGQAPGMTTEELEAWYARRFGFFRMQASPSVLLLRTARRPPGPEVSDR